MMDSFCVNYANRVADVLRNTAWSNVTTLGKALHHCWQDGRRVFLAGNGGSDANAQHLANDLLYGVGSGKLPGIRVQPLVGHSPIVTCLSNDLGYRNIFTHQLRTQAMPGDLLVVLSGSGNSENVIAALEQARQMGLKTFALLGYDGGRAKQLADVSIHFPIDDMQIAEDCQQIVGHMLMRWLSENPPEAK